MLLAEAFFLLFLLLDFQILHFLQTILSQFFYKSWGGCSSLHPSQVLLASIAQNLAGELFRGKLNFAHILALGQE